MEKNQITVSRIYFIYCCVTRKAFISVFQPTVNAPQHFHPHPTRHSHHHVRRFDWSSEAAPLSVVEFPHPSNASQRSYAAV